MNSQDPKQHEARQQRKALREAYIEKALWKMLMTKYGRTVLAFMVRGTHNLGHVYTPGMSFDHVAFEAGRQYDARELIRVARSTERCSVLFEQALREYEHEWVREPSGG